MTHTYGWADVDGMNSAHYAAKRRPEWLRLAEATERQTWEAYQGASEKTICLRTIGSACEMNEAWDAWKAANAWLLDCRHAFLNGTIPASLGDADCNHVLPEQACEHCRPVGEPGEELPF